jgi:hypothetical protein
MQPPPSERDHQQRVNAGRRVEDHGALAKQHPAALRDDLVEAAAVTSKLPSAAGPIRTEPARIKLCRSASGKGKEQEHEHAAPAVTASVRRGGRAAAGGAITGLVRPRLVFAQNKKPVKLTLS